MAVHARWLDGFVCETDCLGTEHTLLGDEPEGLGGTNKGPNPFALLQVSLANCTIVTIKGEADLLGVDLEDLSVEVKHKQNKLVGGPRDPEQRTLKITELRRRIQVRGELTEDQVDRLLWAAEHCPVSNSLEGAVEIVTRIDHVP